MNLDIQSNAHGMVMKMNAENLISTSAKELVENGTSNDIISLAEKLDFLDIQLLRKFYMNGENFPFDSQPYCFPVLYLEMKVNHQIKIGLEALRKRLDKLVGVGLLEKIRHSNPTSYSPMRGNEGFARAVITRFFFINGLTKFL